MPVIAGRLPYLFSRLTAEDMRDSDVVKVAVLEKFRLILCEYKRRFQSAVRRAGEGWSPFVSRVISLFNYCVDDKMSSSQEDLVDLILTDEIKATLTEEASKCIPPR